MHTKPSLPRVLATLLVLALPLAAQAPPDSTEAMGQKFADREDGTLRVLLVGSGSSHHFPRDFLGTDAETLKATGKIDVAATPNLEEALDLIKETDVLVFSGNHNQWGGKEWLRALKRHADGRKGLVLLHAATWSHPWEGYNERFVGGRTPSHGRGDFEVTVTNKDHDVTAEVPEKFTINDENYRFEPDPKARIEVCCENAADQTDGPIPSVWIVPDRRARIVCITLGHDDKAHTNEAFKKLLVNAVDWAAGE